MDIREITEEEMMLVSGGRGGYDPAYAGASMRTSQHPSYGGQGGGFVGTKSKGLNLGNIINDHPCATGIATGLIGASGGLLGLARGVAAGAIGGCVRSGNGNGGGSGRNSSSNCNAAGTCSW